MDNILKRPKRIWVIFIWFSLFGLVSLYQSYNMYIGNIILPEGVERPSGFIYYLQVVGFQVLAMVASTLLFFRFAINRWLFSLLLIATFIGMAHSLFSGGVPEQQLNMVIGFMLLTLSVYTLITWYSFNLLNKNYYSR